MVTAHLRFWEGVSPNALRLMVTTMILSILMMGIAAVTRTLFILRLDLGTEFFGVYNAFAAFGYTGMAIPAGLLGRRFGLKPTMVFGVVTFLVGYLLGPLVEYTPHTLWVPWSLAAQFISAAGYSILSVNASPAIMATTRPDNRSKTYSLLSTTRNLGVFVGLVAGGMLPTRIAALMNWSLDTTDPYRVALLGSGLLAVSALFVVLRYQEGDASITAKEPVAREGLFPALSLGLVLVYIVLSQSAIAVCHSFCNAYMDTELHLSADFIGWLSALGQVFAVFIPFAVPRLRNRMDNSSVLILASLVSALLVAPIIAGESWVLAGITRMGVMSMSAIWMPVIQMYQMEMVQAEYRPIAFALVSVALGANFGLISLFGGYIIEAWGYPSLFLIGAVAAVAGSVFLLAIRARPAMQPRFAN